MRVTAIGDIHGREIWKDIVTENQSSHFIFLGDYLDPYSYDNISAEECLENFYEIIDFKKYNSNDVTLLIGNHDFQYLFHPFGPTNTMATSNLQKIVKTFKDNKGLFQFSFQKNDYLFTHAGVTNSWLRYHNQYLSKIGLNSDLTNLGDILNKAGEELVGRYALSACSHYRCGNKLYGGPIWADHKELLYDFLDNFNQIVGHNNVPEIIEWRENNSTITFCDILFSKGGTGYSLNI